MAIKTGILIVVQYWIYVTHSRHIMSLAQRLPSPYMAVCCFLPEVQLCMNSNDKVLRSSSFGQLNLLQKLFLRGNCTKNENKYRQLKAKRGVSQNNFACSASFEEFNFSVFCLIPALFTFVIFHSALHLE